MKTVAKIFLVFLLLVVILCGVLAVAYINKSFPVFNDFVDKLLFADKVSNDEEIIQEAIVVEEVKEFLPTITGINSLVKSSLVKKSFLSAVEENYDLPNINLEIKDNGYSMSVSGDYSWETTFDFPIVTSPVVFSDKIICILANSSVVFTDLINGNSTNVFVVDFPCKTSVKEGIQTSCYGFLPLYEFLSESGESYSLILNAFDFKKYNISIKESEKSVEYSVKALFEPTEKFQNILESRLTSWGLEDIKGKLPKVDLFLENEEYVFSDDTVHLYVYHPENTGKHTVGLTNKNGVFVSDNAVVAVFKEDGSLLDVSLDYVATEPNVTVYFDDEFYYIVAYRIFVDETSLPEVFLSAKKAL